MLVTRIVEESRQTRAQLARDAGLSEDTLWSWMTGRRNPTPEKLRQLAEGLRNRSATLAALADELERDAQE